MSSHSVLRRFFLIVLSILVTSGYLSLSQHHVLHQITKSKTTATQTANSPSKENPAENSTDDDSDAKNGVNESCLHCLISHVSAADSHSYPTLVLNINTRVFTMQDDHLHNQFEPVNDRNKSPPVTI